MLNEINVTIKYEKRRSMKAVPSPAHLLVKVPHNTPDVYVANFLLKHEDWIKQHCKKVPLSYKIFDIEIDWGTINSTKTLTEFDKKRIHKQMCIQNLKKLYSTTLSHHKLPPLSIKSLSNAWGKCYNAQRIELHWKTATLPIELATYVIWHELAHMNHMNHSSKFWAHLETLDPQARKHHRMLKTFTFFNT